MKIDLIMKRIKKIFFFLSIFLLVILFQSNSQIINSLPMETYQEGIIVEELRLRVPSKYKEVWLKGKSIWSQDPFRWVFR